ncbi:MAG: ribose-5-phosphate isomerase RpiA [Bdellovibrionales bacterium]|nr:ribose-5-phosphate isomerase RpiA [Bdellovibrionales bacterium]
MSGKAKELIAQEIAGRVQNGQCIGVGTGTTVAAALEAIRHRIQKEALQLTVVPTSLQSAWTAEDIGLTVLAPTFTGRIDWSFDGADEVDSQMRLIKGRGGAMFHEKIVAEKSLHFVVIADSSKCVNRLGELHPVPIEFEPAARGIVERGLLALGGFDITLRECQFVGRSGPYYTQCGNLVFDVRFSQVPESLESEINAIPGVIENGLFLSQADELLMADDSGITSRMR